MGLVPLLSSPHCTDKETKACGGDVTCSKSHVLKFQSWDLSPSSLGQSPCFKPQCSSIQLFDFEGSDSMLDLGVPAAVWKGVGWVL